MLEKLRESLLNAPIVHRGEYHYFIHPISDGVPSLDPELLNEVAEHILSIADTNVDKIIAIEAMGIPLATLLSLKTGIPFCIIRKRSYELEGEYVLSQKTGYSKGTLYINDIKEGDSVLIVDDVISTGGTLVALHRALKEIGATVSDSVVVIERGEGCTKLRSEGFDVKTLISIGVDKNGVFIKGED